MEGRCKFDFSLGAVSYTDLVNQFLNGLPECMYVEINERTMKRIFGQRLRIKRRVCYETPKEVKSETFAEVVQQNGSVCTSEECT